MKKLFLLITILFLTSNSFSQVTLTSSMNPLPGITEKSVDCDTTGIVQGNAGANQTWNFTSLARIDRLTLSWITTSSTTYAFQFPTSNIAYTIDNSSYQYFTSSSSNLLMPPGIQAEFIFTNLKQKIFLKLKG